MEGEGRVKREGMEGEVEEGEEGKGHTSPSHD